MLDLGVMLLTAAVLGLGYAVGYRWGYEQGETDEWWRNRPPLKHECGPNTCGFATFEQRMEMLDYE